MREGFKPTTAEDLIRMYDLNGLAKERKQIKQQNKEVSALVKDFAETINEQIKELEDQVDGKISTWFFSGIPSAETEPEVNWTTDEEKAKHIGDIYYDQDTGNSYTYMYVDGKYQWTEETVGDVSEVLAIANKAQDTADRKRQIFVIEPYPPYEVGDMWIKEDKDIYRCRAKRLEGSFSDVDWIPASDYTNDDYAKGVEAQLDVFKEVVETDYVLRTAFETSNEGIRSEVSSLTTIVERVNVEVQDLNNSVEMFSVELAQNGLTIPTNNNKTPITSTAYEIPYYGYFKGKQVIPNVSINGSHSGITASSSTIALKFEVKQEEVIELLSNSYEVTFTYLDNRTNYTTTKNITITLAPKGSDGTSVNILGSYDSYEELKQAHPTGNIGDAYIVQGDMYVWNGEEQDWVDVGDIQGPAGSPGKDGTNGKSAYQIWLDNGNVGTEEEYLESLKGSDGYTPVKGKDYFDGDDGKSAYQLWLDAGNTGSIEDYQASLKGEKGDKGNDATTYYTWLKYADTPTSGMSDNPTNKKYMGVAYNKTTPTESNNYNDYAWSLIKGEDGEDGITPIKGVDYFDGYTPVKGKDYFDGEDGKSAYELWLEEGNTGSEEDYLNSLKGDDGYTPIKGKDYFDGEPGDDGVSIVSVTNYYAKNTSATTPPTSGWDTKRPTRNKTEFLWVKELIKFSNNTEQETTPFVVTGDTGDKGDDGYTPVKGVDYFDGYTPIKGVDYFDGQPGTSTYFYVRYSANSNGSGMTTAPTSTTKYMGTASTTSPTAPTTTSAYTWVEIKGDKGDNGSPGQPGDNGLTSYLHIKYSADGVTFTPADDEYGLGEKPSAWIGQYVDYTEDDSENFEDYTWYKFTEDIDDTLTGMQEDIANNKTDLENTKQDLLDELDKKASVENVTTVLNEVKNLQTSNSQTIQILKEIQTNGVTQVKTENNYTFNEEGLIIEETGAKTKGIFDNKGVDIIDTQGNGTDLLYAGYVDEEKAKSNEKLKQFEGQTVVYSDNMYVGNYLMIGTHSRLEDYEDGTGVFYLGG